MSKYKQLLVGAFVLVMVAIIVVGVQKSSKVTIDYNRVNAQSSGTVLTPQDFSYLGFYNVQTNGLDTPYGQGLTHRYVNGDLRFMYIEYHGGNDTLTEFSLAGKNFGDKISARTNSWDNFITTTGRFVSLWWDDATQRLWTTSAVDYTTTVYPTEIYTRTLNNDGTISNLHGPVSLEGISAKRAFGGAQKVPSWFQTQYGVGPYVVGWGGYTSLVAQGGTASLGPTMYAIPDPANYADGSTIPTGSFKTIMDHAAGTISTDWYPSGTPTTFDRGVRITNPVNYFDGGDNRPNGTCDTCNGSRPTDPPLPTAQWLSPAPDSLGRWVWGDEYFNTGAWIDTPTKSGFIAIGSFGGGDVWYCASTLCYDKRQFELHIFDPATLGNAATGSISPWLVKPASETELILPGIGGSSQGDSPIKNIGGATFDPVSSKLYLMGCGVETYLCRLYVFGVNTGSVTPPPPPGPTPTPTPTPTPPPPPSLSLSPISVAPGGNVQVSWSNIVNPSATDWLALYNAGASNTAYIDWMYVSCTKTANIPIASGSCNFPISSTASPGSYEIRLLSNDTYTSLASQPLTVANTQAYSHILLNPTSLFFQAVSGGSIPAPQNSTLSNTGSAALAFNASTNQTWCHVTPLSGSVGTGSSNSLSVSVDAPSNVGSFGCTITFQASNADNSPQNLQVTYTVNPSTQDTTAPVTNITSPLNNTLVDAKSTLAIQATASDNVGVTSVQFYVKGSLTCTDNVAPFICNWKVPAAKNQAYSLQTKAYDAKNNIGTSAIVQVKSR